MKQNYRRSRIKILVRRVGDLRRGRMTTESTNEVLGRVQCPLPYCSNFHEMKVDKYGRPYFFCPAYVTNVFLNGPAGRRFFEAWLSSGHAMAPPQSELTSVRASPESSGAREEGGPVGEYVASSPGAIHAGLRGDRVVVSAERRDARPTGVEGEEEVWEEPREDSQRGDTRRADPASSTSARGETYGRQAESPSENWVPMVAGGSGGFVTSEVLCWGVDTSIDRLPWDAAGRKKAKLLYRGAAGVSSFAAILTTVGRSSNRVHTGRWFAFTFLLDTIGKSVSLLVASQPQE